MDDLNLQPEGLNEIKSAHAAELGASAKDGAVTLSSLVDHYLEKLARERAAKRTRGAWPLVRLT